MFMHAYAFTYACAYVACSRWWRTKTAASEKSKRVKARERERGGLIARRSSYGSTSRGPGTGYVTTSISNSQGWGITVSMIMLVLIMFMDAYAFTYASGYGMSP